MLVPVKGKKAADLTELSKLTKSSDEAVVLTVSDEALASPVKAIQRARFSAKKSYVIIGENPEVIAALAQWMSGLGARKIQVAAQVRNGIPVVGIEPTPTKVIGI